MSLTTVRALLALALLMLASPSFSQTRGSTPDRVQQRETIARTLQTLRTIRGTNFHAASPTRTAAHDKSRSSLLGSSSGTIAGAVRLPASINDVATIVAISIDSTREQYFMADAQSNGTYVIDGVPAGSYYVFAQSSQCLPEFYDNVSTFDSATAVVVRSGQPTTGIDFSLEMMPVGEGTITGTVTAAGGGAIAGAQIYAMAIDAPYGSAWAEADASGRYTLSGLFGGHYVVQALAPEYLPEFYRDARTFEQATAVEVTEPATTSGIDFVLDPGATISGRVVDASGSPMAGVMIDAMANGARGDDSLGGMPTFGSAVTDENGEYVIGGLEGGEYLVSANYWSSWIGVQEWYDDARTIDDATPIETSIGQTSGGIDFVLEIPTFDGIITGVVRDTAGNPIEGAYIMAMSSDSASMPVSIGGVTAADGSYTIEGIPDGAYLVAAMAQGGWEMTMRWWRNAETPEEADPVEVVNGATTPSSIDFTLPLERGTASISGTVRLADGSAALGAQVAVLVIDPTDSSVVFGASAITDDSGAYTLDYLPAGTYLVYAMHWDGDLMGTEWYLEARDPSTATPVVLADGEQRAGVDFSLEMVSYLGSVRGRITDDATGAGVANAFVELEPAGPTLMNSELAYRPTYALTDASGYYAIDAVPAGEYYASVIGDGTYEYHENATRAEEASTIEIVGGDTTTLDFGLTPRRLGDGSISGRVSSNDSRAISAGIVVAFPSNGDQQIAFPAVAERDGSYVIGGLADGDYYVYAFSPEHIGEYYEDAWDVSDATIVRVRYGAATTGIDFGLDAWKCLDDRDPSGGVAGGIVYGHVTDASGRALADANIYVVDGSKSAVASTRTKADGSYEIASLPPGGEYRIMASSVGYTSEYNDDARHYEDAQPVEIRRGRTEVDFELTQGTSRVDREEVVSGLAIAGTYPNPFTASTTLRFSLERPMSVDVTIVDARGTTVATLHRGQLGAGPHELTWSGRDDDGTQLASGAYFARVAAGGAVRAVPVTIAR